MLEASIGQSSFLGAISRRAGCSYELVRVETGAVLASRLRVGEVRRLRRRRPERQAADGGEQEVLVGPARWAHTFGAPVPVDVAFVGVNGTVLKILPAMKPRRVAASRGAHAVIEADAGFFERTETGVGDRVAIRGAQSARPARDIASSRSGFEAVPAAVRAAARESVRDAIHDLDEASDPWDISSEDLASAEAPPPSAPPGLPLPPHAPPAPVPPHAESAAPGRPERSPLRPAPAREAPRTARPTSRGMPAGGVELASLVARGTPVAWFEAVAIAQELHAALLRGGGAEAAGMPKLGDVAITAEGNIAILAAGRAEEPPVPGAARMLLALVGEAQSLPLQLRLLVLQELSPSPVCRTALEFSTRLALFERPGRQNTIREVYERFQGLPPVHADPPAKEAVPDPGTARVEVLAGLGRRALVAAAASLLIVAVGAAVAWLSSMRAASPQGPREARVPLSRAVTEAGASISDAAASSVRGIADWLGMDSGPRPAPPAPAQTIAVPPGPPAAPARRRAARPAAPVVPAAPAPPQPPAAAPVAAAAPAPDTAIYTAADTDVVPPKILRARMSAGPEAGLRAGPLPEVELVVSPSGEVESVRLVTPQAGVRSAMMLSAIKAWRFDPARLNSQPVRYRLLLRLTHQ